jgi:micrococcal nuclease
MFPYPHPVIAGILATIVAGGGFFDRYIVVDRYSRAEYRADKVYAKEVLDGDTFKLDSGETVRLAEVNAPELDECYGPEAKAALTKVLAGKPLRLIRDEVDGDKFGRYLRIVQLDPSSPKERAPIVQELLAERGFLEYSPHGNRAYQESIERLISRARERGAGLWGACKKQVAAKEAAKKAEYLDEDVPPPNERCTIKGNISEVGKMYFTPQCRSYTVIKVSPSQGESYFCTEKEAEKAGFTRSRNCSAE